MSPNSLVAWTKAYEEGRLEDSGREEIEALQARVQELERLVGRLTLENQFLKKRLSARARSETAVRSS